MREFEMHEACRETVVLLFPKKKMHLGRFQVQLREKTGIPRVGLEVGFANSVASCCTKANERRDIELMMQRLERPDVRNTKVEKPRCRTHASSILMVAGALKLFS